MPESFNLPRDFASFERAFTTALGGPPMSVSSASVRDVGDQDWAYASVVKHVLKLNRGEKVCSETKPRPIITQSVHTWQSVNCVNCAIDRL